MYDKDPETGSPVPGSYHEIPGCGDAAEGELCVSKGLDDQFRLLWRATPNGLYGVESTETGAVSADEEAVGLGCRTGLCRWRKGPWRIALVSDDRRLAEACASADIVLATVDAQARCRGPRRPWRLSRVLSRGFAAFDP